MGSLTAPCSGPKQALLQVLGPSQAGVPLLARDPLMMQGPWMVQGRLKVQALADRMTAASCGRGAPGQTAPALPGTEEREHLQSTVRHCFIAA